MRVLSLMSIVVAAAGCLHFIAEMPATAAVFAVVAVI
jgi:hypothetical protein